MGLNVAQYLFSQLKEAGVGSVHGVPGDYNLQLLDHVAPAGLDWVGNCNELNAAYAADGYARIKGIGAIVAAFGVGELSALNGVGGAYTEKSPVFVIVGTPLLKAQADGIRLHHSLCNGRPDDFEVFANMHNAMTVAQEVIIDPMKAPGQIKRLIRQCILQSRPVYLRVPMDVVNASIPESAPEYSTVIDLQKYPSNSIQEHQAYLAILERIRLAETPLIRVDVGAYRYGLRDLTDQLIQATDFPTVTTPMGKGAADETARNFHGIMTPFPGTGFMPYFQSSDLVIDIGQLACDNNSYYFKTIPDPTKTIAVSRDSITVCTATFEVSSAVVLNMVLATLAKEPQASKPEPNVELPNPAKALKELERPASEKPLSQDYFWHLISHFFNSGDIIITESGTAQHGGRECVLPSRSTMLASGAWLSIGWALGAAQGAALAQHQIQTASERGRTILFQGDGSFQMAAQELSTILRKKLNMVFFLLNNDGYTIERFIHGPAEAYNDVHMWDYLDAPAFFRARSAEDYPVTTSRARTWGELDEILKKIDSQPIEGFHMVEIIMAADDVPMGLRKVREIPSSVRT